VYDRVLNELNYHEHSEPDLHVSDRIHDEHNYHDFTHKTDSITIGFINVCGLKSKFISPDFEDYISEHDVVCCCETKLATDDVINVDGYSFFQKSRKIVKRSSGGVAIFIKNELCKFISILETDSDFSLWFKCDKILTGYPHDTLYCVVYIPPENSNYSSLSLFDNLEEDFLSIHNNESVCILGDFNSRTKDLSDLIGIDPDLIVKIDYVKTKLDEEKRLEELGFDLNRASQDTVSNNYGYRLLETCKKHGCLHC
jgi:exonuclease III